MTTLDDTVHASIVKLVDAASRKVHEIGSALTARELLQQQGSTLSTPRYEETAAADVGDKAIKALVNDAFEYLVYALRELGEPKNSIAAEMHRATTAALKHAWHGERTRAFSYDEWARLVELILGSKDLKQCPTVNELEELTILLRDAPSVPRLRRHEPANRWSFTIDTPSPSLNVLRRQYANARHYAALRNGFETYMMVARVNNKIPPATKIRRVHITRHAHSERSLLDIDNLIGGLKPVIDAMVRQKLIVDDNAEYLNAYYGQRVDGPARLVIVIEEM